MGKVNALFQDAIEKLSKICPDCDGDGVVVVEIYRKKSFERDVGLIDCEPQPCERCSGEGAIFIEEDEEDEY